jgi:hypothetical protein
VADLKVLFEVDGIAGSIFHQVCFVAGTQVVVAVEEDGNARGDASAEHAEGSTATAMRVRYKTVAIETLVARGGGEMGDGRTSDGAAQVVLTRDQHDPTGPLVRRRITRTYQRTAYALQVLTLRDEDGNEQTLRVTEEHPFYVDAAGWTPAKSLESGDMLLGTDGTLTVVANEHEAHPNGVTVYNLEVEQAHTYFVLAEDSNDAAAVWVHNAGSGYRELNEIDAMAIANGERIMPKGTGGTIVDHIQGYDTKYISLSRTADGTARFRSGNGLIEVDLNIAKATGSGIVPHKQLLQAARRHGRPQDVENIITAEEFLIKGGIDPRAVKLIG